MCEDAKSKFHKRQEFKKRDQKLCAIENHAKKVKQKLQSLEANCDLSCNPSTSKKLCNNESGEYTIDKLNC